MFSRLPLRRSSRAPVSRSEPKTSVHTSKGRLVVTRTEPRSYLPPPFTLPLEHRELPALESGCDLPRGPLPSTQGPRPPEPGHPAEHLPQHTEAGNQPESGHSGQTPASWLARRLPPKGPPHLRSDSRAEIAGTEQKHLSAYIMPLPTFCLIPGHNRDESHAKRWRTLRNNRLLPAL